jgi:hypothetical protein
VGPDGVVVAARALDQHLGFVERREDLAVKELVSELGVEALAITILPGTARFDEQRLHANSAESLTALAANSGPVVWV